MVFMQVFTIVSLNNYFLVKIFENIFPFFNFCVKLISIDFNILISKLRKERFG